MCGKGAVQKMKTRQTLINSSVLLIQQILSMLLAFVNRRLFAQFLSMEYLGYTTLFSEVLVWVTFVDTGFSAIMSYRVFQAVAQDDAKEIRHVLAIYQKIVNGLCLSIAGIGVGATLVLPTIIKDPPASWTLLYKIYWVQLLGVVFSYMFSSRRILFLAKQREYYCASVDTAAKIMVQIFQLIILWRAHSLLGYLLVASFGNLLANLLIYIWAKLKYPSQIPQRPVRLQQLLSEKDLWFDIKNAVASNIANTIYFATDSLVISRFCGILDVARYGTYSVLLTQTMNLGFTKIVNGFRGSIGNLVYENITLDEQKKLFEQMELIGFFLISILTTGYVACCQTAVELWMGQESLLPVAFLVITVLVKYVAGVQQIVYLYRLAFGKYDEDRNAMLLSAVLNVVLSIAGAQMYGVTGVALGTLIANTSIAIGRARIVVKDFLNIPTFAYVKKHATWFGIVLLQWGTAHWICKGISISWPGLLGKGCVAVLISVVFNSVTLWNTRAFCLLRTRAVKILVKGRCGQSD